MGAPNQFSSSSPELDGNSSIDREIDDVDQPMENFWIRLMTFIKWYPSEMPSSEKLLLLKLDLSILVFGCLSFFTKYLDQQSLTNAFVSGMREEIGMWGNELNDITAVFWAAYCTAMIPAAYFITKLPVNIVLPSLEIGWGLATFGLAWVQNVQGIFAMRFFVGLFECCSFTGTIYIIGSWYKPSEIARRVAFFFIASPGGTMFAGYFQTAAHKNLDGVHGISGWRWLFIIDAIITIVISVFGYIVFPDTPCGKKPLALNTTEHTLARNRLRGLTAPPQLQISKTIFKRVLGRWHFYAFVTLWTMLDLNILPGGQPFSLYLKAKPELYSISKVNLLPTGSSAISIVAALGAGVLADRIGTFWPLALATTVPVLIGNIILNIWHVGEKGRLAGFFLNAFMAPISPLAMSWASVIMANDAEERAVVLACMNSIGQGIMAGSQVKLFPAVGAPRWILGFRSSLGTTIAQFVVILAILYLSRREARNRRASEIVDEESPRSESETVEGKRVQ